MNVFVLSTGRCGSTTFAEACKHMTNFTVGHESNTGQLGENRLQYPSQHIEVDNRLSWMLGGLDAKYRDDVYYVHLIRAKRPTVASYMHRWKHRESLVVGFTNGILMRNYQQLTSPERETAVSTMYDTINTNIRLFLRDKPNACRIEMEQMETGFTQFWQTIGAEGKLEAALQILQQVHNDGSRYESWVKRNQWHRRWKRRIFRWLGISNG